MNRKNMQLLLVICLTIAPPALCADLVPGASEEMPLTLRECVMRVLENNLHVKAEGYFTLMNDMDIQMERSLFDPVWSVGASQSTYQHRERIIWAPSGLQLNRGKDSEFYTSVTKEMTTGGTVGLTLRSLRQENLLFRPDSEYTSGLALEISQPLLKNMGRNSSLYKVRIAQKNREISFSAFQRALIDTVHQVEKSYWDILFARRKEEIRQQSWELAVDLLKRNQKRADVGMLPSYELLENQSQVASRKENLVKAVDEVHDVNDRLSALMNLITRDSDDPSAILPTDEATYSEFPVSVSESLQVALETRPDLKESQLAAEQSKIKLAYARNQSLPELNVVGGVGLHGFDMEQNTAYDDMRDTDTYDWSVGVVFKVPIGFRGGRARVKKYVFEREQVDRRMEDLKQRIVTEVRDAARQILTDRERVRATVAGREFAEKRLEVEERLYDQGMSTTHDLLEYQEDLAVAQLDELSALIDYQKAIAALRFAEGTLLKDFGIELVEAFLPSPWE